MCICKVMTNLVCVKLLQSCATLCDPMDCSPPGSSVHGILQTRILEWVAMPSSRDLISMPCISCVSCIVGEFFTAEPPGKPHSKRTVCIVLIAQWYPTLCDPMDCSPQVSSLHGILQYSCLENPRDGGVWWAAIYGITQSRTRLK